MKKSTTAQSRPNWRRSLLSLAVGAALFTPMTAMAVEFELKDGEVTGSLDTTVSYGALWRVTAPHKENLAIANGGSKPSANFDNGNQNYERGDLVSSLFKMSNDLELNYKNYGAFFRVASFYDHSIQNKDFDPLRSDQRTLRNRIGHDYEILDAYIRGSFNVGSRKLDVRAGKQVISWGESTFIPNGINVINPVDVAKLRAPGAELKEAFLPVNMIWLSQELSDNLTIEAFNQFSFKKTRLEPNGSYFSTNDFASPGATQVLRGSGTRDEENANMLGQTISRTADRDAKNQGQYGFALRLLTPEINNSEFGFYFLNYHSRTPLIGGTTGSLGPGNVPVGLTGATDATYFNEYPENIKLYGVSFSTLGPLGIALQGEYSYRPNQPLQLAAPDLLAELLTNGCANTNTGFAPDQCTNVAGGSGTPIPAGTTLAGFKRVKFHQFQMTGTQTLGPQIGADQVVVVAEAGYTYLDLPENVPFNAPGVDFGSGPTGRPGALSAAAANATSPLKSGTLTTNSYGYRTVLRADYNSAVGSINLSPRLAWSHDLRGTSPSFVQGTKAITLGLTATYQSNLSADLSYTNFFGGEGFTGAATGGASSTTPGAQIARSTNNPLSDRDFIAATVSYSF
ncbi:DUF1302 domain-containing protein [Perlucidibaca aquatica]|uniref:DUF1302 domain-containing protein n=1 Tax=Perlucidibaca aquatica TaxID=1852776 RepID=UPI0009ECCBDD|nr:DUF1302 domain-containing protein [Perlucidibaca aquatica]